MAKKPIDISFLTGPQAAAVTKATRTSEAAAARKSSGSSGGSSNDFISELQKKLLSQSDLISSGNTGLEQALTGAVSSIEQGRAAGEARIETDFSRGIKGILEKGGQTFTGAQESQRGFAVNRGLLDRIANETEDELKELDRERQTLLQEGNASAASKIADLQFQALQFRQQSQQQVFNNMISAGTFAQGIQRLQLDVKRDARAATQQEFANSLASEQFEFTKLTSLEDQRLSRIRINLMSQELKLKQSESGFGLKPDPGFATVGLQNDLGNKANEFLLDIQSKLDRGDISPGEEEEAATIEAYMQLRRTASRSQADDDALAELMGLSFDDDGELGFIGGVDSRIDEETSPLFGEQGLLGFLLEEGFRAKFPTAHFLKEIGEGTGLIGK